MLRAWLALAVLCGGTASGAAPSYSSSSIVNASNYAPGPFAPGSVVSIFGAGLARSSYALAAADIHGGQLPNELNYVRVYISGLPAPMLYVSDSQINFIMPLEKPGSWTIRVATEGGTGPEVPIVVVDAAPALFQMAGGFAIATHVDNSVVTPDSPAHADETIVVYATGLGLTSPSAAAGEIAQFAAQIVNFSGLKMYLGGSAIEPIRIKYAGLTPGSAGLYQINVVLPGNLGMDPEIRVMIGDQSSPAGLKLAWR